jgi:hypothetical protein
MPLSFFSQPRFSPLAFPGWPEPSALASSTPRIHSAISLHKTWHRWNSVLESRDDGAGGPKPPCQRNRHLPNCPIAPGSGNAGRAGDQGSRNRCEAGLTTSRSSGRNSLPCARRSRCSRWSYKALNGPAMSSGRKLRGRRWRCGGVWLSRRSPVKTQPARRETPSTPPTPPKPPSTLPTPPPEPPLTALTPPELPPTPPRTRPQPPPSTPSTPPPERPPTPPRERTRTAPSPIMWATVTADAQWLETNKEGLEGQPLMARGCARRRKLPCQLPALGPQTLRCIRRQRTGADKLLGANRRLVPGAAAE